MATITTPTPTASGSASAGGSSVAVWLTFAAAIIAALVSGVSIYFVRKTGKATAKATQDLADAAKKSAIATEESARAAIKSADAASKSSTAATAAVEVNARSADAAHRSADAAHHSATSSERAAEIAAERAEEESLLSRYRSASEQLDYRYSAIVRLAGVYAMAHLADDWPEQRQMCIDVLCAYLRMPIPEDGAAGELQVRASIVRLIDAHVTDVKRRRIPNEMSWSTMSFDFSGGHFQNFRMEVPVFRNHVTFAGASFTGQCQLWAPTFDDEADFNDITVEGRLSLTRVTLGSNFLASRFHILPGATLSIAQSWVSSQFAQILSEDPIAEGNFQLSVHPYDGFKVCIERLEAKTGSRMAVESHSNSEGVNAGWFNADEWMVHPDAIVWLPVEAAQLDMPWLKTSVARSGSVKFGDSPALG
jgi:hypothetical protein